MLSIIKIIIKKKNDGCLDYQGKVVITGGEDGICRMWSMNNEIEKICEFAEQGAKVATIDIHNR